MAKRIAFVVCIVAVVLLALIFLVKREEGFVIKKDPHFVILEMENLEYRYYIYNSSGKLVHEGKSYRVEPLISYIDDDTIQILLGIGTDTFQCSYYNILKDKFSESYESPVAVKYNKIAYLTYDETEFVLVVEEIFEEDGACQEFFLDFSVSIAPIKHAEFLDENTLYIIYESQDSFKEKEEVLILDSG